jgi:hypothetical protein
MHLHLGVHSGAEEPFLVVDPDQHRKHRDVLLGLRLRLDLEYCARERPRGKCFHRHGRALPRLDLSDVSLIHQGSDLHQVQIGHLEQHGSATHVVRWR